MTPSPTSSTEPANLTAAHDWIAEIYGPGMWPIWLCSFVLVVLIIERALALRPAKILDPQLLNELASTIQTGDLPRAIQLAEQSPTLIGQAWAGALRQFTLGGISLAECLTHASLLALKPLKRNIQAISTIAAIAPLLGLLGTIIGMIMAFGQIADTGGADKSQLAGAISLALFTTAGGMLVAIPAIVIGRYFTSRIISYSEEVEAAIHNLNQLHLHHLASK